MRYNRFRAQGYLIGSGTIESGCKQIVTQRLKRSGAQWTVDGAVQTAKARTVWLSGDWSSLWYLFRQNRVQINGYCKSYKRQ